MERRCSKCDVSKSLDYPKCLDGKRKTCKDCRITGWVPLEDEKIQCIKCKIHKTPSMFASHGKQKPSECKICRNKRELEKRNKNREEYNKKQREDWLKNNVKRNSTRRKTLQKRRDEDPSYRIRMNMHTRLSQMVTRKVGNTMELAGCSLDDLCTFLEAEFSEGMNWQNYGLKGWHIDHIRPCASFNLEDPEEQKKCFHWTNLQPLWAIDNIRKSDTWEET
jgi:hypothetical protein